MMGVAELDKVEIQKSTKKRHSAASRRLAYRISFKTEEEMIKAIEMIKKVSSDDALFACSVKAVKADDLVAEEGVSGAQEADSKIESDA
jgi:hypothetical protein